MRLKYLPPVVLQISGLILLAAFVVIWALTGRESFLLVGAAMTLIGAGSIDSARQRLRDEIEALQRQTEERGSPR